MTFRTKLDTILERYNGGVVKSKHFTVTQIIMNEVRPLWGHHNSLTQSRAQPTFSNKNPDCKLIFHLNPLKTIQAQFYDFAKFRLRTGVTV